MSSYSEACLPYLFSQHTYFREKAREIRLRRAAETGGKGKAGKNDRIRPRRPPPRHAEPAGTHHHGAAPPL